METKPGKSRSKEALTFDKEKIKALVNEKIAEYEQKSIAAETAYKVAIDNWREQVRLFALGLVTNGVLTDPEEFWKIVTNGGTRTPCLERLKPPPFDGEHEDYRYVLHRWKRKLRAIELTPDGKAFRMTEEAFYKWIDIED